MSRVRPELTSLQQGMQLCETLSSPEGPSWGHRQIHQGLVPSTEQVPMQPWEELGLQNWVPAIKARKKSLVTHKHSPLCYFLSGLLRPSQNVFKMPPQDPYLPPQPVILHRPEEERPASSWSPEQGPSPDLCQDVL